MTAQAHGRGRLVTMEGGEGGGKSTQARALVARLRAAGIEAVATREPGGSPCAEAIRSALLSGAFEHLGPRVEALLFAAARIDHLAVTIKPALSAGRWVVSDRFHDSTLAYQGAAGEVEQDFLDALGRVTLDGLRPDLTLILDVPATIGLARAATRRRRRDNGGPDRFEKEALGFHEALRASFLAIAAGEPDRCVIVDGTQPPADVEQAIWDAVSHRLGTR